MSSLEFHKPQERMSGKCICIGFFFFSPLKEDSLFLNTKLLEESWFVSDSLEQGFTVSESLQVVMRSVIYWSA